MADKTEGVLAVLRELNEFAHSELSGYAKRDLSASGILTAADKALEAVAELLAADEEYDEAWADDSVPVPNGCFARRRAAKIRRAAAIRAMRGEPPVG